MLCQFVKVKELLWWNQIVLSYTSIVEMHILLSAQTSKVPKVSHTDFQILIRVRMGIPRNLRILYWYIVQSFCVFVQFNLKVSHLNTKSVLRTYLSNEIEKSKKWPSFSCLSVPIPNQTLVQVICLSHF